MRILRTFLINRYACNWTYVRSTQALVHLFICRFRCPVNKKGKEKKKLRPNSSDRGEVSSPSRKKDLELSNFYESSGVNHRWIFSPKKRGRERERKEGKDATKDNRCDPSPSSRWRRANIWRNLPRSPDSDPIWISLSLLPSPPPPYVQIWSTRRILERGN